MWKQLKQNEVAEHSFSLGIVGIVAYLGDAWQPYDHQLKGWILIGQCLGSDTTPGPNTTFLLLLDPIQSYNSKSHDANEEKQFAENMILFFITSI